MVIKLCFFPLVSKQGSCFRGLGNVDELLCMDGRRAVNDYYGICSLIKYSLCLRDVQLSSMKDFVIIRQHKERNHI